MGKIKQRAKFPSMEGCRAAAGWSEWSRKSRIFTHWIATVAMLPRDDKIRASTNHTLVIASHRRWRGNLFFVVVSLGYCVPCAYPRICSNCASACFHILGFIASHHRWRGNPVNKTCRVCDTSFAL